MPPPPQTDGLRQAYQDICHSLWRLVGSPLSDDDWRLASIGVAQGGLGARSALLHAPAAYISSLAQTRELCARMWPGFDEYDLNGGLMRSDVESSLGASFLPNTGIYHSSGTPSQKSLSAETEPKVCRHVLDLTIAIGWLTSASTASLGQVRGFLLSPIPLSLVSRPLSFGSAYAVVSECRSGRRTPAALSAARLWISGATTPLFAGVVATV